MTLGIRRASRRSSWATWSASSRVGQSTSACGARRLTSRFCSTPRPNAAVLPLPVLACAIRSRPSRMSGRLCAWIGVICSKPRPCRLSSKAGRRGREEKDVLVTIRRIAEDRERQDRPTVYAVAPRLPHPAAPACPARRRRGLRS
ncbi:Uncharacterised protein [Bordetella pertussis]|nr:Uncharacterised protein [Bordetella pertussis]